MRVRSAVPAGVFDAGFAALATFAISIYAARALDSVEMGFFAVFFTAFLMAAQIPYRLVMLPTEIHAMTIPARQRMTLLMRSLARGLFLSVIASALGSATGIVISGAGGFVDPMPFAITAFAASLISPLQDHLRRMLHAADRSWLASVVSIIQAGGVGVALGGLILMGVDPMWVPFSALALANLFSSMIGIALARFKSEDLSSPLPAIKDQLRSGRWMLVTGLLAPVGGLVVQSIVIAFAGAAILGLAEFAKVVGRPVLVLSIGLGQALAPRSIAAAQRTDRSEARRIARIYWGVFLAGSVIYAVIVSFDSPLNVAQLVVPNAYQVAGLVLAVCVSNIVQGISFPGRYELLGAGKEPWVAMTESLGQLGRSISATATSALGAFVIPLGDLVLGLVRILGYGLKLPAIYELSPESIHRNSSRGPE